jgi:SAM-dependent methyltransferase
MGICCLRACAFQLTAVNSIKIPRAIYVSAISVMIIYLIVNLVNEPETEQDKWKYIWLQKGKGDGDAHQLNGFSLLNETMWTKLVCTVTYPISNIVSTTKDVKILDAGCGSGAFIQSAKKCPKMVFDVKNLVGIDYSPTLIQKARLLLPQGRFVTSGIQSFSWIAESSFDIVWSFGIFIYLPNVDDSLKAISEFFRVTKPGGTILIGDVADLDKQNAALKQRSESKYYQTQQQKLLNTELQHLYLNKSIFIDFCKRFRCTVSIKDEVDIGLHFYEPARYRYIVLIHKLV